MLITSSRRACLFRRLPKPHRHHSRVWMRGTIYGTIDSMPKKNLTKASILVPVCYNDGTKVPKATFRALLDELYRAFGGWTNEGLVEGAYRMASGRRQVDKLSRVAVVLKRSELPVLRAIVKRWCLELEQEAMYLEYGELEVELITPRPGEEEA